MAAGSLQIGLWRAAAGVPVAIFSAWSGLTLVSVPRIIKMAPRTWPVPAGGVAQMVRATDS